MPNQAEVDALMAQIKLKVVGKSKASRSASRSSDNHQILVDRLAETAESIYQELEEWANAVSEISKQVEVLGEIGSLIRERISSLQTVANYPEMRKWKKPLQSLSESEQDLPEENFSLPQVAQPAATVAGQAVPVHVGQDQELAYLQSTGQGLTNLGAWEVPQPAPAPPAPNPWAQHTAGWANLFEGNGGSNNG